MNAIELLIIIVEKGVQSKMTNTLKEEAEAYVPATIKNVTELEFIDTAMTVQEENDVEFPYKFIQLDGERYKVANSVIAAIKEVIKESPQITKFKIKKTGEGIKTKYMVVPLA